MADRWATFDCYGTLIDWNGGIRRELARLFGEDRADFLLARYHELEPDIQAEDPGASYRDVMARALEQARTRGERRPRRKRRATRWGVRCLTGRRSPRSRRRSTRPGSAASSLAILSNSDPDLIAASIDRIGVPFDDAITASEIGSYKPDHGHWRTFEQRRGRLPDVHVGASLFHDMGPAVELGIPCVWVNRLGEERGGHEPTREIHDLAPLPAALAELAP